MDYYLKPSELEPMRNTPTNLPDTRNNHIAHVNGNAQNHEHIAPPQQHLISSEVDMHIIETVRKKMGIEFDDASSDDDEEHNKNTFHDEEESPIEGNANGETLLKESFEAVSTEFPSKASVRATSIVYTLSLYYAFLLMGFYGGLLGPSLLEFSFQTDSSVTVLSYVLSARSFGLFLGAIAGGHISDRFVGFGTALLCAFTLGMILMTVIIPFIADIYFLAFMNVIHGLIMGIVDNLSQVLLIRHWKDKVGPYMQGIHCAFGVGAFISPLILSPFFPEAYDPNDVTGAQPDADDILPSTDWHYAWLISASMGVPAIILLLYFTFRIDFKVTSFSYTEICARVKDAFHPTHELVQQRMLAEEEEKTNQEENLTTVAIDEKKETHSDSFDSDDETDTGNDVPDANELLENDNTNMADTRIDVKAQKKFEFIVVILCGVFLLLYVGSETGFGSYIYSYSVIHAELDPEVAAYVNSLYWGAFALGRFLGIFLSMRFTPEQMVLGDLAGAIVAIIIIVSWSTSHPALWIGSAIYGISVGSIFASTIIYVERLVSVNGKLLSVLVVFAAFGDALMPLAMGATFDSSMGSIGMMYIAVAVASAAIIMFASTLIYVRSYHKNFHKGRFQKLETSMTSLGLEHESNENNEANDSF